jgi:hypothetical protein
MGDWAGKIPTAPNPQGLKPFLFSAFFGTTEVVP